MEPQFADGVSQGVTAPQKQQFFHMALNAVDTIGGMEDQTEPVYTRRAFALGRALRTRFGGWWAVVCGKSSTMPESRMEPQFADGVSQGVTAPQKQQFFHMALNAVDTIGGMEDQTEPVYTRRAFALGRALRTRFGGWWAVVCGKSSTMSEAQFSYAVRAVRHACFIVNEKHFFFIGQTLDPIAPVVQTDEWNLL
eukprot:TRINITY_DN1810_c0_g1_i1.p2 TRINITY_DN1810_c0_g1~~TRINITY_DN1810_c0_g1_i1.p2  ORF type:complete len:206 (-),score=42.36 TRINITY_DN1810_c0_g1_i1:1110-1694(-)